MKLEINSRRKTGKSTNRWKLNNTLLNSQRSCHREFRKYLETNENTILQNLRDAAKAVGRGMFIAVNTYIKKEVRSQINYLNIKPQDARKTN